MKHEIVAPAGDIKKLDVALEYGADAVYLAGKKLGMRVACKNFDYDDLKTASLAAHSRRKRFYVTLNIFPYDNDFDGVGEYVDYLQSLHTDALIISDLGLIEYVRKNHPNIPVHVSTQANIMNSRTARVYADMGVSRIVLARELDLPRIRKIRDALPDSVALEAFVHGAMCISYSGRCLLSNYLTGRSANRGECNQACRMKFTPECSDEALDIVEDDGTYIFGGNDLNMIEHLRDVLDAGVTALKIEGRVKSEFYVACVVNAYKNALKYAEKGEPTPQVFIDETAKVPNRGFNTGFYYGQPQHGDQIKPYEFCGIVMSDEKDGAVVEMRNRFRTGENLEVLSADNKYFNTTVTVPQMEYEDGERITDAKVPMKRVKLLGIRLPELSILRRPPERLSD